MNASQYLVQVFHGIGHAQLQHVPENGDRLRTGREVLGSPRGQQKHGEQEGSGTQNKNSYQHDELNFPQPRIRHKTKKHGLFLTIWLLTPQQAIQTLREL